MVDGNGQDPEVDGPDEDWDDLDDEAFFAAWEAAEQHAADVLDHALEGVLPPAPDTASLAAAAAGLRTAAAARDDAARWMLAAAGVEDPESDGDEELLIAAVGATISMLEDPGLPPDDEASIMSLELADWVGAVLGLVRGGVGAPADPASLVRYGAEAEEIEAPPLDPGERHIIEHGFRLVLPAWEAAGVVDGGAEGARLTAVGRWLLPTAAIWTWSSDPESP